MQIIRKSAEHHFLTTLDELKADPAGWMTQYFSISKYINHLDVISSPGKIEEKLEVVCQKSRKFVEQISEVTGKIEKGYIYQFSDQDIVVLAHIDSVEKTQMIKQLFKDIAQQIPSHFSNSGWLEAEMYNYQKLADSKLVSSRLFEAYLGMADQNKVGSLGVRRSRRSESKVLVIEDDHFTASYTANILSKDYDLVIAKTGEEGLLAYIEQAPDIVFLDLHLPGLSGQEVLEAIHAVDPKAFVVMLSVDTKHKNILRASQTGAQKFLKKPFSKERLLGVVRNSPFVRSSSAFH